ncbi:L-lysine 2,3-aminomutase [Bradyrhizobium sp. USDA 3397]
MSATTSWISVRTMRFYSRASVVGPDRIAGSEAIARTVPI